MVTTLVTPFRVLITLLITTHEAPSGRGQVAGVFFFFFFGGGGGWVNKLERGSFGRFRVLSGFWDAWKVWFCRLLI